MSIGLLFWILMILWFFFDCSQRNWGEGWKGFGGNLLLFVLLFLLGWHSFGFVLHG